MEWYIKVIKERYAQFTGRAGRSEFWMFTLVNFAISMVLNAIGFLGLGFISSIAAGLGSIYGLAVLIPGIAVGIRRLHDTDKSGWYLLLSFVPIIGTIALIYFLAQPSNPDTNQFGPNPEIAHFLD